MKSISQKRCPRRSLSTDIVDIPVSENNISKIVDVIIQVIKKLLEALVEILRKGIK